MKQVQAYPTLIILAKGKNHAERNELMREKASLAKRHLGTQNAETGHMVIESFETLEELKAKLWEKVQEAIRRVDMT